MTGLTETSRQRIFKAIRGLKRLQLDDLILKESEMQTYVDLVYAWEPTFFFRISWSESFGTAPLTFEVTVQPGEQLHYEAEKVTSLEMALTRLPGWERAVLNELAARKAGPLDDLSKVFEALKDVEDKPPTEEELKTLQARLDELSKIFGEYAASMEERLAALEDDQADMRDELRRRTQTLRTVVKQVDELSEDAAGMTKPTIVARVGVLAKRAAEAAGQKVSGKRLITLAQLTYKAWLKGDANEFLLAEELPKMLTADSDVSSD